jgi:two-component system sensor histidine kinase KdpD
LTFLCRRLHADFAIAGFLFLLVVLVQSFSGDILSSGLVAVAATALLDYFFVDPLYTFRVARTADFLALSAFLITALVVTRLVCRVRAEAATTRATQERLAQLYRLAQLLLAVPPQTSPETTLLQAVRGPLEAFREVFGIRAVCLFDVDTAETQVVGGSQNELAARTRAAYLTGRDGDDRESGIAVRSLRVSGNAAAAIGFEGLEDPAQTAGPLAALAGTVLERARALRLASESSACTQAEVYRSAILDALAHEFKTPLATILAAVGGLREAGPLRAAQLELAETVETEAARLGNLTSRLLRMARVDRESVKPRMEQVELMPLLEELTSQYKRVAPDLRIFFLKESPAADVRADPELLRLAISQLLENACKYSRPGAAVSLRVGAQPEFVEIRVSNWGSSIPAHERQRIFDRFYRGSDAVRAAPGSGLGLYIARKIAVAHGGRLELEADGLQEGEVRFRLIIPVTKSEADHVVIVN